MDKKKCMISVASFASSVFFQYIIYVDL